MVRLKIQKGSSTLESRPTNFLEPSFEKFELVHTLRTELQGSPWDEAHQAILDSSKTTLESRAPIEYAEPDIVQDFVHKSSSETYSVFESRSDSSQPSTLETPDEFWPMEDTFAWHLDYDYSQLRRARIDVGEEGGVVVGILDTGYDPLHITCPKNVLRDKERNYVELENFNDATDPVVTGIARNPGHGTATIAILAGNKIQPKGVPNFNDYLGGAPHSKVIPVRIANSVIHFRSSSMTDGINYAVEAGCKVISISMGGIPSKDWAQAVNNAYDKGVVICAAAGNRIGKSAPKTIVYPARFRRVIAACGATADKTPYYKRGFHREMQGCFGPSSKMKTAMAAYTPNMPWAEINSQNLVNLNGAGTSSATPQIAATAALWLQKHNPNPAEKWKIVEAVRHALFSSADKSQPDSKRFFGQGILRAYDALQIGFNEQFSYQKQPLDKVSFPLLRVTGLLESRNPEIVSGREMMYEVEALQVFEQSPDIQALADGIDPITEKIDQDTCKCILKGIKQSPLTSDALQKHLDTVIEKL